MPCSSQIISEMLPEIHTMKKFDFLNRSKNINSPFVSTFDQRLTSNQR